MLACIFLRRAVACHYTADCKVLTAQRCADQHVRLEIVADTAAAFETRCSKSSAMTCDDLTYLLPPQPVRVSLTSTDCVFSPDSWELREWRVAAVGGGAVKLLGHGSGVAGGQICTHGKRFVMRVKDSFGDGPSVRFHPVSDVPARAFKIF